MKLKLSTLINSSEPLTRLYAQETSARLAFTLSKVKKAVDAELQAFEEQRVALVKKYGEEKEGNYSVGPATWAAFTKEYTELMETETEVAVEPLPVDALDGVKVSASDLGALDWLVVG